MKLRHYLVIADALRAVRPSARIPTSIGLALAHQWEIVLYRVADALGREHNFDRGKWIEYALRD